MRKKHSHYHTYLDEKCTLETNVLALSKTFFMVGPKMG